MQRIMPLKRQRYDWGAVAILLLLSIQQAQGAVGDIFTVAGLTDPTGTYFADISSPGDITVDAVGNLYITDVLNHRIRKRDTAGNFSTVAGTGLAGYSGDNIAATAAQLNYPNAVTVDGAGNLYIADSVNSRIRKVDTTGTITTVAGTGVAGFSGDTGAATSAQLDYPSDVAVDSAGNLYIADYANERIRKVDISGIITTVAGTGVAGFSGDNAAATSARLNNPWALDLDGAGNLYISDAGNARIRKVDTSGIITTVAGTGVAGFSGEGTLATSAQLNNPSGVTADASGNIFISDASNARIRKIDVSGIITTYAGTGVIGYSGDNAAATAAQILAPRGLATDSAGNLYISDSGNDRIRRVDTNGIIQTLAGTAGPGYSGNNGPATAAELNYPYDVVGDSAGNFYIADTFNQVVRKVDSNGIITTLAGTGVAGYSGDSAVASLAQLNSPRGLAVDGSGNLYITDYFNQRVRKVDSAGIITTVAGTGSAGFSGDNGPATAAQLLSPSDVAVDGAGNLYISDTGNARIRKVDTSGTITTVVGTGTAGYSGDGGAATAAEIRTPAGLFLDDSGNLYFTDHSSHCVRKVDSFGVIMTVAGTGVGGYYGDSLLATVAQLNSPRGVTVDNAGNLYIADTANHRIREVDTGGYITTLAGTGMAGYSGEYTVATAAQLNSPFGLALASSGNLYIADYANHRIRELVLQDTVPPVITLLGGNPMTVAQGGTFSDPGVTVSDNVDTGLAATATGTVDTGSVGSYTLTYNASDSAGNAATPITRTVTVSDQTPPVISLIGSATINLTLDSPFSDPGVSVSDNVDTGLTATVTGTVDTGAIGNYTLTYSVSDSAGNAATPVTRTVIVSDQTPPVTHTGTVNDQTPPVISLIGSATITIAQGSTYSDPGVSVSDNTDTGLIATVAGTVDTGAVGSYTLTYSVSDSAGNAATPVTRTVTVSDQTPPVISLIGSATITLTQGSNFSDPGVSVADNVDTGRTATVTGTVDMGTIGSYTLTYNTTDSAGNSALPVTRTVNVTAATAADSDGDGGGGGGGIGWALLLLLLPMSLERKKQAWKRLSGW